MKYIETYELKSTGIRANISIDEDGCYTPWVGGCAVCMKIKTLEETRKFLFDYITNRLKSDKNKYEKILKKIEVDIFQLSVDSFYLGKFLVAN